MEAATAATARGSDGNTVGCGGGQPADTEGNTKSDVKTF